MGRCARPDRVRARAERAREDDRRPPAEPARRPLSAGHRGRSAQQPARLPAAGEEGGRGDRETRTKTITSPPGSRVRTSISAPTSAAHGIVMTHATRMFPRRPSGRPRSRRVAPAPITEPEIDVGGRDREAEVRGRPEDRGARRLRGEALRRVDLRDPLPERPDDPPAACVGAGGHRERRAEDHPGRRRSNSRRPGGPEATSASAMIPIVFWASFVPCVKATKPPETSCSRRKTRFTLLGERRRDHPGDPDHQRDRHDEAQERREQRRDSTFSFRPFHWTTSEARARPPPSRGCRRSARGSSSTAGRGTR